jgi:hypothetical protein
LLPPTRTISTGPDAEDPAADVEDEEEVEGVVVGAAAELDMKEVWPKTVPKLPHHVHMRGLSAVGLVLCVFAVSVMMGSARAEESDETEVMPAPTPYVVPTVCGGGSGERRGGVGWGAGRGGER